VIENDYQTEYVRDDKGEVVKDPETGLAKTKQKLLRFATQQLGKEAVKKIAIAATQQAAGKGLNSNSTATLLRGLGIRKPKGAKGFWDMIYKTSGQKENISTAFQRLSLVAKTNSL
jgi:hypothetical protein